jgi:hypothetical protein
MDLLKTSNIYDLFINIKIASHKRNKLKIIVDIFLGNIQQLNEINIFIKNFTRNKII